MVFSHNSDLNGCLIRGSDFTGLNAPAQSDGSYYRVQLLSSGQFRIAKNIGGSFDSWNDFLTNADLDGHLAFLSSGETALEAGSGNTRYRLQIDNVGNVLIFKSTDGGSTWPTSKVIASM